MRVLAISVHPDDETLGCGGTLLRHAAQGDELHWLIVTRTYAPTWSQKMMARKSKEIDTVAASYGMKSVVRLGLPTAKLDTFPQGEIIEVVRNAIDSIRPEVVYLVHDGDVHTDHHAVFTATMCVLKAFYMKKHGVRRVLSYETLSSTDAAPPQYHRCFVPTVFQEISPYIDRKIEIMDMYSSETQPDPMPRGPSAIRALARFRGATIAVDYAEAFVLIREVN
jgi:LmbE family N-acetylglucosaminyl deacetylase